MVVSPSLGKSYDCPSTSEATPTDMGKSQGTKPQKHNLERILLMYCMVFYFIGPLWVFFNVKIDCKSCVLQTQVIVDEVNCMLFSS